MRLFHADFPAFRGRGPVEYSWLFLIYIFDPLFFTYLSPLPPSSNRIARVNINNSWNSFSFFFGRFCLILLVTFLTQFYHRLFTLFIFLSRQFLPFLPSPSPRIRFILFLLLFLARIKMFVLFLESLEHPCWIFISNGNFLDLIFFISCWIWFCKQRYSQHSFISSKLDNFRVANIMRR